MNALPTYSRDARIEERLRDRRMIEREDWELAAQSWERNCNKTSDSLSCYTCNRMQNIDFLEGTLFAAILLPSTMGCNALRTLNALPNILNCTELSNKGDWILHVLLYLIRRCAQRISTEGRLWFVSGCGDPQIKYHSVTVTLCFQLPEKIKFQ